MVEKKGLGKTVLGWFVVDESAEPAPVETPEQLIAKYAVKEAPGPDTAPASAARPEPPLVELKGELPKSVGGAIDFAAVYGAAEISTAQQERVEKALTLLGTLPAEAPRDVKKQIVEASLKAFGIPIDQIIEAGAQQIQALEAYIQRGQGETQSVLSESNARIEELSAEIVQLKKIMEDQVAEQQRLAKTCNGEKLRVQVVLEFFGQEAVARVVKDSPKLVEPK
jgi:hypothetical protein